LFSSAGRQTVGESPRQGSRLRRGIPRLPHPFAALLALATLVLVCGCSRRNAGREVWAEVDGHPIYRDQVEQQFRTRMASMSEAGNPAQALSLKLNILNELISNQILLAHAARSHIAVSEAEVDNRLAQLESPYTHEEFQKKLAEQGMDTDALREQTRQGLVINKLINKEISAQISVSEEEIRTYYERNRANFNVPETEYHLAQIAATPVRDAEVRNLRKDDATTEVAAQRKIQALYARLRAGDDFASVAQEYSEDPRTAAGGGDMGFVPTSALDSDPVLKKVIASLKVGQFSGVIRTKDGFHIVKLLGVETRGQRDLSDPEVESAIRRTLASEKEQLLKAAYIELLRDRTKVVNYLAEKIVGAGGNLGGLK